MLVRTTQKELPAPPFQQVLKDHTNYYLIAALIGMVTPSSFMFSQDAVSIPAPAAALVQINTKSDEASAKAGSSSTLAYWYGPAYRTPFVSNPDTNQAADIPRSTLEYSRLDCWTYGSNFADVMVNQSSMEEPASSGGAGATEVYVTMRSSVGLNEATRWKAFSRGPVRDVSIEAGTNLETKNSSFAPSERTIYFGPKFQMAVPRGYFDVGLHLRKEWNHEGVLGRSESYDPGFNIESGWMVPFAIGKAHLGYSGFAEYNTRKGKDSFGVETMPEFLVRSFVSLDLGGLLYHKPHVVDLNCGFWYWHNEYGKPSSDPGTEQKTPMFGITLHLNGGGSHQNQSAVTAAGTGEKPRG